jgi:CRISPR-associated protein Cas5 subtype I-B
VIGAILGIHFKDLSSKMTGSKIGLGILNEIRKIPFSTMHTHSDFWEQMYDYMQSKLTAKKKNYYARVNMELLVNPKYRIYFSNNKLSEELASAISKHETTFTPYLGTSSMIANFAYIGSFEYNTETKDIADVESTIPYSDNMLPNVLIENDKLYAIEQNLPGRLDEDRKLLSSYSVVYNPKGQTIKLRNAEVNTFYLDGQEKNFVFLPS